LAARTVAEMHLEALNRAFPGSSLTPLPDGTALVAVPNVPLPPGWNQSSTVIRFIMPVGYPAARPDCFWADPTLRLANGNALGNAQPNPLPHGQGTGLWFSWHLQGWDPIKDSFLTWLRVVEQRLAMPR
jgi:Prokaryotic E2 family E